MEEWRGPKVLKSKSPKVPRFNIKLATIANKLNSKLAYETKFLIDFWPLTFEKRPFSVTMLPCSFWDTLYVLGVHSNLF